MLITSFLFIITMLMAILPIYAVIAMFVYKWFSKDNE